ncbi:alpha/beta hydrolase [Streptomyces purpurascens]|uniref:alpha/beta hydrolase n=1 Tax=Streptomyces purpurascens TaxID=1924 RepID=UPI00167BF87A|nr:alpha/beta hydrolase [Streptomyces purpurascens]MCE7052423.1 alpha/beta hydrolase [Streptomyces purpurascens]GHA56035.1 hypothetical protein GCM10010303_79880 [Streptomyces purpurascens]
MPTPGGTRRSRRLRFALTGHVMRRLPTGVLRSMARRGAEKGGSPPPFADFVAFLEALGPAADRMLANPEEVDLVRQFPELAQVAVRPLRLGPAEVSARVYRHPAPSAGSALVWVHGGAYVSGSLDMHESHWVALSLAARGIPVLALDYRKALHGVRYPVPRDDVMAGWRWAVEHSAEAFGVAPDALHLGGGSAGGNLAASVTRRLIEEGAPAPRSLVLAYATVHARVTEWDPAALAAVQAATHGACFALDWIEDKNTHYAGLTNTRDPAVFPGEGDPLDGHPPTLFLNCENDTVRPSAERFARQLDEAGVPHETHLLKGEAHGSLDRPTTSGGQEALDHMTEWLVRPRPW